jgi:porin
VHKHFPKLTFNGQAGAFIGFETAYRSGHETLPGTVRAGYWRNTGRFEDILNVDSAGNPIARKGNEGFYLIADKLIFASENNRCLEAFLQLGSTPGRSINEFKSYIGGGLTYSGLFPRRRNDEIGIAAAHARVNNRLVAGYGRDRSETTLEITYRAAVHQHLSIQPDVQLVFNPGADSSVKNAIVAGLRFDISY